MQRDRTTNDRGSPPRPSENLALNTQVPIESDADAGFASRTRRAKAVKSTPSAVETFGAAPEGAKAAAASLRRRRGTPKTTRRRASEVIQGNEQDEPSKVESGTGANANATPRTYAESLGQRFRHVRTSSFSAFGSSLSPFLSSRGLSNTSSNPNTHHLDEGKKRPSQSSITRWFGGVSDSSSEDEDEETDGLQVDMGSGSGPSGDEERLRRFEENVVVEDYDGEGSVGDLLPVPGGERVGQEEIDGGRRQLGRD
jgi:hypothetical protein